MFAAPTDVGGRYSALSVFGLVPAVPEPDSPGLVLGAALGELALAGRDKATFITSPSLAALPAWIEQLVAESTGKDGKGIVPVVDEPLDVLDVPERYGADRVFVYLRLAGGDARDLDAMVGALEPAGHPVIRLNLNDPMDLGVEFFRWEVAVAAAGPEGAAERADAGEVPAPSPEAPDGDLGAWAAQVRPGDYLGLQAYLAPNQATTAALQGLRCTVSKRWGVATTLGYGPRFLHSTGQLHKGGPNTGVFMQIVDDPGEDLDVPEAGHTFGGLIRAQAQGDLQALRQKDRRTVQVQMGRDVAGGLARLADALCG